MGFTKAGGGLGGAQPAPFANTRIRATFPNSKHGDDMMFVFFYSKHGWALQKRGVGGGATPPICKHKDPGNLDMMLVFYCTRGLVAIMFIMILILTIRSTSNSNGNNNNRNSTYP